MTIGFPIEDYNKSVAANADRILAQAADLAKSAGAACQTVHVPDHHPAEGILEAAKTRGCDLIVMASHGRRGVSRLLLGSQANRVVTHSTLPVLICR
jgi:nucleotide-binding universal stress UspA family protein